MYKKFVEDFIVTITILYSDQRPSGWMVKSMCFIFTCFFVLFRLFVNSVLDHAYGPFSMP